MRLQFGGGGAFPRSIWAPVWPAAIVNRKPRYSIAGKFLPAVVVAIG